MRRILLLVVAAACSTSGKREEVSTVSPPPDPPPAAAGQPRVFLSSPTGEIAVRVEVVSTPPTIQRGLMFRQNLPLDAGMLFLMKEEEDHTFYMRNTLIPLDMIFIARDLTIAGIVENAEPKTETLRSVGKPSLYVLEVNGGWTRSHQVVAGAKVRFDGVP
ncbi:MAG TPA: DUF192 domain-containing protein [Kofleriaceae bacterium]|nr:DUF192 domain-containing protein [Kofleriaceae bacterium]